MESALALLATRFHTLSDNHIYSLRVQNLGLKHQSFISDTHEILLANFYESFVTNIVILPSLSSVLKISEQLLFRLACFYHSSAVWSMWLSG